MPSHDDNVGSGREVLALERKRLTQEPFNQIPVHRAADLPGDGQAQPGRRVARRPVETRRAPARGRRVSDHAGRPGRSRRCATAAIVPAAAERRASRASHREPLAALRATALQRQATGARAHPVAEAVSTCALALFRLIGAFHGSRARYGTGSEYTQRLDHTGGQFRGRRSAVSGAPRARVPTTRPSGGADGLRARRRFSRALRQRLPAGPDSGIGPLIYSPPGRRRAPHQSFSLNAPAKESLGAARASRADRRMARRARRAATSRGGIHLGDLAGPARGEVVAGQRAVGDGSSGHAQLGRAAVRPAPRRVRRRRCSDPTRECRSITSGHAPLEAGPRPSSQEPRDGDDTLNPRYSFEQFIIGDSNRLAHAAALAVAERPGEAYNPLFLHAPPGLGKTHLLHAIGNYVRAFGAGAAVRYATVEAFTNQFINALSSRSLHHFKSAYRDADVLLIDDVQFLASKAKTEEEFFHTFNTLRETGRQLVITCDRLPRQLVNVEERLRERFESGLVVDVGPPDSRHPSGDPAQASSPRPHQRRGRGGARPDRRPRHHQRPRARGSIDPRRRLALADRAADQRRARQPGARRDVSGIRGPGDDDRGHPARRRGPLRPVAFPSSSRRCARPG